MAKESFKLLWLTDMLKKIRLVYTPEEVSNETIKIYLLKKYNERYLPVGRLYSNVTQENIQMNIEEFIDYFLQHDYILTGYNCLFENPIHNGWPISIQAVQDILASRKTNKKQMVKYDVGSQLYKFYNNNQLAYKRLANSYYGVISLVVSLLFNPFIQNSVTMTGQDIITSSICAMESFMTNSNKLYSMDDFYDFIRNCISDECRFNIDEYIDRSVSSDKFNQYILTLFRDESCYNESIVIKACNKLTEHQRNIIYYKNQLLELYKNKYFIDLILDLTKQPYILEASNDEEQKIYDEYKDKYQLLKDLTCEFVFYNHILDDRMERAVRNRRDTIKVVDTDSNFIYADNQIEAIANTIGKNDEDTKFAILNLVIDVCQEVEKYVFETLTKNFKIDEKYRPIINMKNEFVYKTLLITQNKKSYAGWLKSKLGKRIDGNDEETHLDMKGMSIKKTTVNKAVREALQKLLIEDILQSDKISLMDVVNKYDEIYESIETALKQGNADYLIPKQANVLSNYDDPYGEEVIRGVTVWNLLEPDLSIIPPEKTKLLKLKVRTNFNDPDFQLWKTKYPEKYRKICKNIFEATEQDDTFRMKKFGFDVIAIPYDLEQIPDYIIPLADIDDMIKKQISNGNIILKAIGIICNDTDSTASNIVEI